MTTSENESVPATSHWSFAYVTVKTVMKKRPSTKGARSATARGRSRAIAVTAAVMVRRARAGYGGWISSHASRPAPRASAAELAPCAYEVDPVVHDLPPPAPVRPHLRVDVADGPHPAASSSFASGGVSRRPKTRSSGGGLARDWPCGRSRLPDGKSDAVGCDDGRVCRGAGTATIAAAMQPGALPRVTAGLSRSVFARPTPTQQGHRRPRRGARARPCSARSG